MEVDNRLLVAVAVIVIIVVLFVFFGEQKKQISFSEGINKVNGLWVESGFTSGSLNELSQSQISLEQLNVLNGELILFQDSLSGYKQSQSVEALKDYVEIHLYVVEELKLALKIKNTKHELETASEDDICFHYNELNALGENTILLNQQMKTVNEAIYFFSEEHPDFLDESNFESLLVDASDFDSIIAENHAVLEQLREACT